MTSAAASPRVVAVVVTRNRPALLMRCLDAVRSQDRRPDLVIVVDNAGEPPLDAVLAPDPHLRLLRLTDNLGPAAAFGLAIREALDGGADFVWMMDDDGVPADPGCLSGLLATAAREDADLVSPLIRDIDQTDRLAFPIRQRGRTRFTVAALEDAPLMDGFAHLFNGALVAGRVFARIGLPDPRLFIRGDEVEFLLRARRAGLRVLTDRRLGFLHPSCGREIHPILGGRFYAMIPNDATKCFYQFRNRGWIFARYGMWSWLAADHVRYACWYLSGARDPVGYLRWLRTTWIGVLGRLGSDRPAVPGTCVAASAPAGVASEALLEHAA